MLAGGGVKGGLLYGQTDADGPEVAKDKPVTEGDLFATIYTALGINPRQETLCRPPADPGRRGTLESNPRNSGLSDAAAAYGDSHA